MKRDIGTDEFLLLLFCFVLGYDYISKVKFEKLDELDTFQENNKLQACSTSVIVEKKQHDSLLPKGARDAILTG